MFGRDGRLWLSAIFKGRDNSAFCKAGSDHPSAKLFPLDGAGRRITILDVKTKEYKYVDTCFSNHHLQFGFDANETLWTSGGGTGGRLGQHQEIRRDRRRRGFAGLDGVHPGHQRQRQARRRLCRAEPAGRSGEGQAHPGRLLCGDAEPGGRQHLGHGRRASAERPVWRASIPAPILRKRRLPKSTIFRKKGFGTRGGDIDSKGVLWISATSGHIASFDRSKCKGPLNGPTATGRSLPGRLDHVQISGAELPNAGEGSAEVAAITAGSTSTTSSASAMTCRCPPPTSMTAWPRW